MEGTNPIYSYCTTKVCTNTYSLKRRTNDYHTVGFEASTGRDWMTERLSDHEGGGEGTRSHFMSPTMQNPLVTSHPGRKDPAVYCTQSVPMTYMPSSLSTTSYRRHLDRIQDI